MIDEVKENGSGGKTIDPTLLVDTRWIGPHGIGRYSSEIISRLLNHMPLPAGPPKLSLLNPIWLSITLARLNPKAFFSPGFNPPIVCSMPFIFYIHDLIHLNVREETSLSKRIYYNQIVKPVVKKAFRVLTVSEFSRQEIIKWSGVDQEQVVVASPGVSAGFTPDGSKFKKEKPYFLFVGNSKPHKNLRRVLRAFREAKLEENAELILCTPNESEVQLLIRENELIEVVEVTGEISDDVLQSYYRGAVALLFPTLYEGFGLPALEAMACGTPVLTSGVTSLPEVVGDAAYLVDPYSVDSITKGIERLFGDAELRERLKRQGLERSALFSWERSANIVNDLLREAMTA